MNSQLNLSAAAWWKTSTAANEKLRILRDTKVDYIIQYTQKQQKLFTSKRC
jgi:hypothetical protein